MRLLGFEPAPLLIGFVLGPMMEENLRRGLLLARGDYYQLLAQPITGSVLCLTLLLVLWSLWSSLRRRRAAAGAGSRRPRRAAAAAIPAGRPKTLPAVSPVGSEERRVGK